jgi:formylglycine-generating enzyme required for sulfatase activity
MQKIALCLLTTVLCVAALTSCQPRPPADATLGSTWTRPSDGMVMLYVPAGQFEMGCETSPHGNERPIHTVTLDGFWIDRTEVTNGQYALCVSAQACRESAYADEPATSQEALPVVGVSWQDAADYCAWAGGRLPTEAEWEYAARGTDGPVYPWGDEAPTCERTQFRECPGPALPVGSIPDGSSWCGALDMAGNAWEWVGDWFGPYPSETQHNPTGRDTGRERVLRGGAWNSNWNVLRSANRHRLRPGAHTPHLGFRCAVP